MTKTVIYVNILTVKSKAEYYLFSNFFSLGSMRLEKNIFILLEIKDRKGSINVIYN